MGTEGESESGGWGPCMYNDVAWVEIQVAMLRDTGISKDNIGQAKEEACVICTQRENHSSKPNLKQGGKLTCTSLFSSMETTVGETGPEGLRTPG